jgi:hypothetical protein
LGAADYSSHDWTSSGVALTGLAIASTESSGSPTCPRRTSTRRSRPRSPPPLPPPRLPPPKLDSRGLASLTLIFLPCVTKAPYALRTAPKRGALPRNLGDSPLPLSPRGAAPASLAHERRRRHRATVESEAPHGAALALTGRYSLQSPTFKRSGQKSSGREPISGTRAVPAPARAVPARLRRGV